LTPLIHFVTVRPGGDGRFFSGIPHPHLLGVRHPPLVFNLKYSFPGRYFNMAASLRNQITLAIQTINEKQAQAAQLRMEIDLLLGELQSLVKDYQVPDEPISEIPLESPAKPSAFSDN
jgi:hypothetical protein